jgi:hypothetical protein
MSIRSEFGRDHERSLEAFGGFSRLESTMNIGILLSVTSANMREILLGACLLLLNCFTLLSERGKRVDHLLVH